MIPKNSTPLHNDKILLDIIAKGRLSKSELRISAWVWRYSWGFDNGKRRCDWSVNPKTQYEIAKEIDMDYRNCRHEIQQMVNRNILFYEENRYQFNEHFEQWGVKNTPKIGVESTPKIGVGNTPTGGVKNTPGGVNSTHKSSVSSLKKAKLQGHKETPPYPPHPSPPIPPPNIKKKEEKKEYICEPNRFTPSQFIQWWNKLADDLNLPKCQRTDPTKYRDFHDRIRRRLKEYPSKSIWGEVAEKIEESPWLLGEKGKWRMDIDFLLKNSEMVMKIREGKYDG